MSDYLYFTCRWLIHPLKPRDALFRLIKTAEQLECEIVTHSIQTDERGFKIIPFVIRTLSPRIVDRFVEHGGGKIGMRRWQPATAEDFASGQPFTLEVAKDFSAAAEVYGKSNERLEKKLRQ